jgi:putative membrane protein
VIVIEPKLPELLWPMETTRNSSARNGRRPASFAAGTGRGRERGPVRLADRAHADCLSEFQTWKGSKMLRRFQKGDVGIAMVVVVAVVMVIAFFSPWGMHGGRRDSHLSATPPAAEANRSALDLLDEKYAQGEISREEYLRKREDLTQPR